MVTDLRGKTAILTGAAQGLGYAIAHAYAEAGLKLVLMDVQADRLTQVADELRQRYAADCLALPVDLADASTTQRAAEDALHHLGAPSVLVHNAARLRERSMAEFTFEHWQKDVSIILQAAFILSKAVWQPMIDAGGGSIVYLSSGSGIRGFLKEIAYTPGKHGQEGLMKTLALEGEPYKIAVNTITPGAPINTPMSDSNYDEALKQRWVDPALLTPAFVWLAGIDASQVTGQRLDAWQISESIRAGDEIIFG